MNAIFTISFLIPRPHRTLLSSPSHLHSQQPTSPQTEELRSELARLREAHERQLEEARRQRANDERRVSTTLQRALNSESEAARRQEEAQMALQRADYQQQRAAAQAELAALRAESNRILAEREARLSAVQEEVRQAEAKAQAAVTRARAQAAREEEMRAAAQRGAQAQVDAAKAEARRLVAEAEALRNEARREAERLRKAAGEERRQAQQQAMEVRREAELAVATAEAQAKAVQQQARQAEARCEEALAQVADAQRRVQQRELDIARQEQLLQEMRTELERTHKATARREEEERSALAAKALKEAAEAETARLRAEAQRLADDAEQKRRDEEEEERRRAAEAVEAERRARAEAQRQLDALIAANRSDEAVRTPNQTVRVARVGKVNRPDTLAFGFDIEGGDDADGLQPHISRIEQFSEAADAGLQVGDFIVNINGQSYAHATINKIVAALRTASRTGKLSLSIHRDYKGQRLGRLAALQQAVADRHPEDAASGMDAGPPPVGAATVVLPTAAWPLLPATPPMAISSSSTSRSQTRMLNGVDTSVAPLGKGRSPPPSADSTNSGPSFVAAPAAAGLAVDTRRGRPRRSLSATPRRAMVKPGSTEQPSGIRRLSASDLAEMHESQDSLSVTHPARAPSNGSSSQPTSPGRARRASKKSAGGGSDGSVSTSSSLARRQSDQFSPTKNSGGGGPRRGSNNNAGTQDESDRRVSRVSAQIPSTTSNEAPASDVPRT